MIGEERRGLLLAATLSLCLHAALAWFGWRARGGERRDAPAASPTLLVEVALAPSLAPVAPPSPPTLRKPVTSGRRSLGGNRGGGLARPAPSFSAPSTPAPPGADVAAPAPALPVDLTGDLLLSASTGPSTGGPADGTAARGGPSRHDASAAGPLGLGLGDRSGGVALEGQDWSCPWPREADDAHIDEQTVVIRVVVAADGTVESASVVSDPGHGFGPAAASCAVRTRFIPARDRDGRPIRATSPPLLVRFTR